MAIGENNWSGAMASSAAELFLAGRTQGNEYLTHPSSPTSYCCPQLAEPKEKTREPTDAIPVPVPRVESGLTETVFHFRNQINIHSGIYYTSLTNTAYS